MKTAHKKMVPNLNVIVAIVRAAELAPTARPKKIRGAYDIAGILDRWSPSTQALPDGSASGDGRMMMACEAAWERAGRPSLVRYV